MLKVLILLGALGLISANNSKMGKCRDDIEGQSDFSYEEFISHNRGIWEYMYVPNNEVFSHVHKMFLEEKKTKQPGVYESTVYEKIGRDSPTIFSRQVRMDDGGGKLSGVSVKGQNEYKYTVMYYKPGECMYFYLCSPVGGDSTTDYRFVLTNKHLEYTDKEVINELEERYHFKSELRELLD